MTIKQLKSNLPSIKKTIGWSDFPTEKNDLLIQSFIRRSYSQEHPEWKHNQVLELIGDSVLDHFFIKKMCNPPSKQFGSFTNTFQFSSTKTEGELTEIKSKYVNGKELSKHIDNLNLSQFLILGGADEKNNSRNKQSVKEDLFEAILGSVALACGFDSKIIDPVCNQMLEFNSSPKPQQKKTDNNKIAEMRKLVGNNISTENSISKLIELNRNGFISPVDYPTPKELHDDDGNPLWECDAKVKEFKGYWTCSRSSKKAAKQAAAFHLLKYTILGYPQPKN